jgi:hypothetical protein
VSDAELRNLLADCLRLWDVEGRVAAAGAGLAIETRSGRFTVERAPPDLRPVRWLYQTPERAAAGRPPRAAPSVTALLSALRNAMEGTFGGRLRIGA